MFAHQIASLDEGVGMINTSSALSTSIDILNIASNYISHYSPNSKTNNNLDDQYKIESINYLLIYCNVLYGLKSIYEDLVWNDGFIKEISERKYLVYHKENEKLIIEEIGRFRLQQESLAAYFKNKEISSNFQCELNFNIDWNKNKKKGLHISKISLENGYINYSIDTGNDLDELDNELQHFSMLKVFYGYLTDVTLPNFPLLQISDVLMLFHLVQELFSKVSGSNIEEKDCTTIKDIYSYAFRLKKGEMIEYLCQRSYCSVVGVESFLTLLIPPTNSPINFWSFPFLNINDEIICPLHSVTSVMIFHMTDKWLDLGGYDVKTRGRMLEDYIKKSLEILFSAKGYFFKIANRKKFKISPDISEEIDLIVNLKDIVIVAEVKCIRYSMDVRDYCNSFERLVNGAEQVIKKAAFIQTFAQHFIKDIGDISGKTITKVVITNYPTYVGCLIKDIPIVDFHSLEEMIKHENMMHYTSQFINGKHVNEPIGYKTLYRDESEFCLKFEKHIRNMELVELAKPLVEIKDVKMTIEGFPIEIFNQFARFKS